MTRAATLADVAALAGVSGKTVSRVVNHDPNVSDATRRRVQAAIAEKQFRPNLAARSLAAARSFLIGSFTVELASYYYAELYRGAAHACRRHGYHLVIEEFAHEDGVSPVSSIADVYRRELSHLAYDGLLLPPPICDDPALLDTLEERGVRYVRLSPATAPGRAPAVSADDDRGAAALAEHLWHAGHRRFGVVVGPRGHGATIGRRNAFVDAIARLGGDPAAIATEPIAPASDMVECGRNAAMPLLASADRPTAIFAFNDEIAAGVMIAARSRGLSVPDDLAVAGFDDSDVSRLTWPPLTTIRQPIRAMAAAAIDLLLDPGDGDDHRLAVELVIRGSTQP